GAKITVYALVTNGSAKFYKTTYGGQWAYISASEVVLDENGNVVVTPFSPYKEGAVSVTTYIRSGPTNSHSVVGTLSKDTPLTLYAKTSADGVTFYKITYGGQWAYIPTDCVTMNSGMEMTNAEFEKYLTAQGFPESYKVKLRALHQKHPTWVFNAQQTGVSWGVAVNEEATPAGHALVEPSSPPSWIADPDTNYDGRWKQATNQVIAHFMDPRNFLDDAGVYQFLDQRFNEEADNTNNIWNIVRRNNCFMNNSNYVYSLYNAGKASGVNSSVLTAMVIMEQGWRGGSPLISGESGYYNHFNVGAYHAGGMTSIERGLWYASGGGGTSFGRPWTTIEKSIAGGGLFYGSSYIQNDQYTFYTKKFNVMNGAGNIGDHEYSTSITAANGEGQLLKMAYASDDTNLVFWIPVFGNMPSATPLP
ncbi:MAG: SH3 domain-containing protein, partial [Anaerovoracaceae bacterium]